MKTAKRILVIVTIVTLLWMLAYIGYSIYAAFRYLTSFPWWSAFVFATIYFGPALLIEGIVYGILRYLEKRNH